MKRPFLERGRGSNYRLPFLFEKTFAEGEGRKEAIVKDRGRKKEAGLKEEGS